MLMAGNCSQAIPWPRMQIFRTLSFPKSFLLFSCLLVFLPGQ
jgi:hypothetical protein